TPEGGIDGKRRSANARACRDSLQGRRRQHNLSEEAAVAGDQLRPTCICGYFRNLSSLLQSNRPCTKLAWRTYNCYVYYPLVHVALISTCNREVQKSRELDLQDLLQRRGACWIGCAAGTSIILVSTGRLHWPHGCLIRRSCLDCGLFVVSPVTLGIGLAASVGRC